MTPKKKKVKKIKLKRWVNELDSPEKHKMRAVAVKYDLKKDKAPKILAIGKGSIAQEILNLAEENRIPMYEDKSLTQLLQKLNIDEEIPPHLYSLVAEVLAFVYQLDKLAKKKKNVKKKFEKK
jgi:flagellar biosynthesis protein